MQAIIIRRKIRRRQISITIRPIWTEWLILLSFPFFISPCPPPFFFPSIASITRLFSSNPFTFQHRSWHFCLLTLSLFAPFSFENFPHLYKLVSGISQLSICILTMNTCLPCLVWIILNHVVLAHNYTWLKRRETIKKTQHTQDTFSSISGRRKNMGAHTKWMKMRNILPMLQKMAIPIFVDMRLLDILCVVHGAYIFIDVWCVAVAEATAVVVAMTAKLHSKDCISLLIQTN